MTNSYDRGTTHGLKPDAALVSHSHDEPIIALVARMTQLLDDLFEIADLMLSPHQGKTEAVIIIKIHEKGRSFGDDAPWGLEEQDLMQKLSPGLQRYLVQYHKDKNEPLVGSLTAQAYLWKKGMEGPPGCPIWKFKFGHQAQTQTHQPQDRGQKLEILGRKFDFPFEKIESCLLRSFLHEVLERASQVMARNNDYIRALGDWTLNIYPGSAVQRQEKKSKTTPPLSLVINENSYIFKYAPSFDIIRLLSSRHLSSSVYDCCLSWITGTHTYKPYHIHTPKTYNPIPMNNPASSSKMQLESELHDILSPIDHVEKITPKLIDKLRVFDQDKVYFPNIKVNGWLHLSTSSIQNHNLRNMCPGQPRYPRLARRNHWASGDLGRVLHQDGWILYQVCELCVPFSLC